MRRECFLIQVLALVLVCGCATVDEPISDSAAEPFTQQTAESVVAFCYEDAAVTLPSPASVQLDPEGRLGARFQGNIDYIRYLHHGKLDGKDMLKAYDVRHYAPGKLLELIWDRELRPRETPRAHMGSRVRGEMAGCRNSDGSQYR